MKKSKWNINTDGYYPYCPNCGCEPAKGVMSNFCPDCGLDMRESELETRYKLILKAYGEHSEYVAGFRACMQIVERNEVCEMKPYEATEIAYKNGYKQGVKDFAEMLKAKMFSEDFLLCEPCYMADIIDQIAKEMGVEL